MKRERRTSLKGFLGCSAVFALFLSILLPIANPQSSAVAQDTANSDTATAIFAGGCFWCMEPPFDVIKGVISTTSGYTGGHIENPSYSEVTGKDTGHYEALKVVYNPKLVRYDQLLEVFWKNIDPLDARGQFCDKGPQYRSAIFVANEMEKEAAKASQKKMSGKLKIKGKIATAILPQKVFYPAEDYHQDYYRKNPLRYKYYRYNCGRDKRLEKLWGPKF